MRAFISVNLDSETRNKIYEIQKEVKYHLDENTVHSIKWEDRDKFHITLFFLGDLIDKQVDIITNELNLINEDKTYGILNFSGKSINAFPNFKNPRVLIIDLENQDEQIFRLYDEINRLLSRCGFEPDKKFHPHITLGRVKKDRRVKLKNIDEKIIPGVNFSINEFYFMESKLDSTGSTYKIIKKFNLY